MTGHSIFTEKVVGAGVKILSEAVRPFGVLISYPYLHQSRMFKLNMHFDDALPLPIQNTSRETSCELSQKQETL
jgi:hypothetical protein